MDADRRIDELQGYLERFDGKHTEPLEQLIQQVPCSSQRIGELLELAATQEPRMQTAATWLLKRWIEQGSELNNQQSRRLLRQLLLFSHWEPRLHVLQVLSGIRLTASEAERLQPQLVQWINEQNKLVRAWAYHGLYVLADQFPDLRPDVANLLRDSQRDSAASVKARVRKLGKSSSWLDL